MTRPGIIVGTCRPRQIIGFLLTVLRALMPSPGFENNFAAFHIFFALLIFLKVNSQQYFQVIGEFAK